MQTGARSFHFALTAVAVISGFVFCNAAAQTYPSKIIRVINPNQPGGNSDIIFRLLSGKMGEILGQQVVFDYRPGDICITNDPDSDCFDPAWSRDGSTIAFACNRGYATYPVMEKGRVVDHRDRNMDIWTVDLTHPDKQVQITSNGSVDDSPVWDASGDYIYFRSNRGGQWGIWKIPVK